MKILVVLLILVNCIHQELISSDAVHLTESDLTRVIRSLNVENVLHRVRRQAIAEPQMFPLNLSNIGSKAVLNVPLPTNIGFFPGSGRPVDQCNRDEIQMEDGTCQNLLTSGNCKADEEVLLDPDTNKGFCAQRLCPPDRVFVHTTQLCHDPTEMGVCPPGRELYYSAHGTSVCSCPDGTVEGDDDLDDDVCELVLGKSLQCLPNQVFWFKDFNSPPQCLPDPCNGANLNKLPSELPYVPSKTSGKCFQLGQSEPACPPNYFFALSYDSLAGECVSLEDAGYNVFDNNTLNQLREIYGTRFIDRNSVSPVGQTNNHQNVLGQNNNQHQISNQQNQGSLNQQSFGNHGTQNQHSSVNQQQSNIVNSHHQADFRNNQQNFGNKQRFSSSSQHHINNNGFQETNSFNSHNSQSQQGTKNNLNNNLINQNLNQENIGRQHQNRQSVNSQGNNVQNSNYNRMRNRQPMNQRNQVQTNINNYQQRINGNQQSQHQFNPNENVISNQNQIVNHQNNQFSNQQNQISHQQNSNSNNNQINNNALNQHQQNEVNFQDNFDRHQQRNQQNQPNKQQHQIGGSHVHGSHNQQSNSFHNQPINNHQNQGLNSHPQNQIQNSQHNQGLQNPQQNQGFENQQHNHGFQNQQQNQGFQNHQQNQGFQNHQQNQGFQNHQEANSIEVFGNGQQPISIEVFDPTGQNQQGSNSFNSPEIFGHGGGQHSGSHQGGFHSFDSFAHESPNFGMRFIRSLGFRQNPSSGLLAAHITVLPSGNIIEHKAPPRHTRSALIEEGHIFNENSFSTVIQPKILSRKKRTLFAYASPSNVFESRLLGCRPGAARDLNGKCRQTILPARIPKRRGTRAAPPVRPSPSCPRGMAFNIRRQCVSSNRAQNSLIAYNLG